MKKKLLSITLTIALITALFTSFSAFSGMATGALAPSDAKIKVLVNPESRQNGNGYNVGDGAGNFIGSESSTANGVNDSPAYPFPKVGGDQATAMVYPDAAGIDWTGAEYFQFYVNNVSAAATDFHWITALSYDDFGDFAALQFLSGSPYYLYDSEGDNFIPYTSGDLGSIAIPANYKGIVKIPVSALTAAYWSSTSDDAVLNKSVMNKIYSIQFYSNQSAMGSGTLYFDELAVVGSAVSSAQTEAQYISAAFSEINPLVPGTMTLSERMDPDFHTDGGVQRAVRADYMGYADTLAFKTVYEAGFDINRTETNFYPMYTNTDFSNAEYFQFYVNNDSTKQGGIYWIILYAYDAAGNFAPLQIINGSGYYQFNASTGAYITKSVSGDGCLAIPAGYKGFIKIPLTSFNDAGWGATTDQNVKSGKDLSRLYKIQMYINQSVYSNNEALYVDAFSILGTNVNGYYGEKEAEAEYLSDYYGKPAEETPYDPKTPSDAVSVRIVDDIADDPSVTPINGIGGMKILADQHTFQRAYMPGMESANWANAKYMQFYVNNTANEPFILWAFGASIGSYNINECTTYLAAQGQHYYLYNKETGNYIEKTFGNQGLSPSHGSINIPANYKGIVKIPMTAFVQQNYPTADKTDWGKTISVDFYADSFGKTLYLDHIAVVEETTGTGEAAYLTANQDAFSDGGVIADPKTPATDYFVRETYDIADSLGSNAINNFGGFEITAPGSVQQFFYMPGMENANWSNTDYFMFYVKNENSTPYILWGIDVLIGSYNLSECEDHYLMPGAKYFLYDKLSGLYIENTCGTEGASQSFGSISVPAYYNGFIKIPKSAFSTVTDESKWGITISFGTCADSNGRSLFVDKFAVLETQGSVTEAGYVANLPLMRNQLTVKSGRTETVTNKTIVLPITTALSEIPSIFLNSESISLSSSLLSTGLQISLNDKGIAVDTVDVVVKGDINGDGLINIQDLIHMKNHLIGKQTLGGLSYQAAKFNGGESINILDLLQMKSSVISN